MRKYKCGSKKKSRKATEHKLRKVAAKSQKLTDFFDVSEPKSNSVETPSNRPDATALRSNPWAVPLSDDL